MKISFKELGEVANLQAGVGFPTELQGRTSGAYPFAKVGDISRASRNGLTHLISADNFVSAAEVKQLKAKIIPKGSVLFAKIGEAIRQNHRVIAGTEILVDNNAMAAIPNDLVDGQYLFQFLRTIDFYALTSSTTVPALRKTELERIKIPLPPLSEQKRIAEILDRAEALRAKRRAALALLDELTQSIFLDMFGDPATNPKGWELSSIGDVADVQGGLQVTTKRKSLPNELPYLRVANVYRGYLHLDEVKTIRATDAEIARTRLVKNDLLIVEGHGNANEIGRGALWNGEIENCVHQNHLIRARFHEGKIVPRFACDYLNSQGGRRHLLRSGKTTSGLNTISVSEVRNTPIVLPPFNLQRCYLKQIETIAAQSKLNIDSGEKLDQLFVSLQQRAFRGEL